MMSDHRPQTRLRVLFVLFVVMMSMACGSAEDSAAEVPPNSDDRNVREGQTRFFENDITGARQSYETVLSEDASNVEARAGVAITSILLLPYHPAVSELMTCCLGADRGLSEDTDVIYRDDGLLDLLSLGVPFDDEEGNPDIKSLLSEDLPWSSAKLESLDAFVEGLDRDMNEIFDKLQGVAEALKPIEEHLQAVADADDFESFFVPGEAFHDEDLSLVIGKTEFALARAALAGTRTAIQFLGAYDYSFTPEEAFGPQWDNVSPQDPEYRDGWAYGDYVTNFFSQRLFREIRNPDRLGNARSAALVAIDAGRDSIRLGLEGQSGELGWENANDSVAREIDDLLAAVAQSLEASAEIPYTQPAVAMDLTSFFETPGRTLGDQFNWLERTTTVDEFEGEIVSWNFTDGALESFFITGVFTPEFAADEAPELRFSGDENAFSDSLFGDLQGEVDEAYFSGR